jgi:hypothetical protein
MKIGDVSRRRRLADPVRLRWYAHHRSVRFSRRMMGTRPSDPGISYAGRVGQ